MPTSTQKPTYADEISLNEMVLPADGACFHCGEAVPKKPFFAEVLGQSRAMCCLGCQLAAQSIVEAGLEQYYLDRRVISPTAPLPDVMNFDVYNHDDIKSQFTYQEDGAMVAELSVVGIKCAACTWLIEKRLRQVDGVGFCQVNLTQQRMRVAWNDGQVQIGEILSAVNSVGYHAKPYRQDTHEAMMKRQNKQMLIRLAVAGFGAMQAMMFSVGLYFGEYSGMAVEHKEFLRLVSMIVSIPVIAFAGVPFFASAWSALKARQVNMDVPVSIALILTFLASSYATLTHQGETYFDSVSMFIFFLLAGRYVEQNARLKAANMASDLVVVEPKLVTKLGADIPFAKALHGSLSDNLSDNASPLDTAQKINDWSSLHLFINTNNTNAKSDVHKVAVGDIVQVPAGGEIVGDGVLLSEMANVSQSLLTGESNLITKVRGDKLLGGSQNDAVPLVMIITETADNSQIALIDRLINRAMSEKPQIAQDADRMARWFVARVLVLAVLVFVVWWFVNPSQALWATVAVLVATCPCALSLATPIALTVATNRLAGLGFLSTRGHTIQTLSEISHVAFDKTGTLTTGRAELLSIKTSLNTDDVLAIAAALEVGSVHPVALSLSKSAKQLHLPRVDNLNHHAGGGVSGVIDGRVYRLGHAKFATGQVMKLALDEHDANMAVVLA
ncbi:MAG: heavy metal translocating P-type ATPase metal-binding domain-containing protein, partial [Moraxella sp.]|nr:heavy metal translocating P-type ATPase metal-binding domain-containing protein [Moraxella sp.]